MNFTNWKKWAYFFQMIGCAQYILFTILGMFFYAGGTYLDPNVPGYSFFSNFISDIGRIVAYSGESNFIAFLFFSIAFFIVGVSLIPAFIAFPGFFKNNRNLKLISIIGSVFGIFTAFCFSGITFAPADINPVGHRFFVYGGFLSGLFPSIFFTINIILKRDYPNIFGLNFMIFTIILIGYVILLFAGPNNLIIQVTGQKVVMYSFAMCLFIHGYGAWKLEKANKINV
jgi:hypothetical protein